MKVRSYSTNTDDSMCQSNTIGINNITHHSCFEAGFVRYHVLQTSNILWIIAKKSLKYTAINVLDR